jgi:hypothetical protein
MRAGARPDHPIKRCGAVVFAEPLVNKNHRLLRRQTKSNQATLLLHGGRSPASPNRPPANEEDMDTMAKKAKKAKAKKAKAKKKK